MAKTIIAKEYAESVCEIKSMSNILVAVGKVREVNEEYIKIYSGKNELRVLNFHERIKINIFNAKLGFKVIEGTVFTSTPGELSISEVSVITEKERRNFFRVDMELDAVVMFKKRGPAHELAAKVLDMSLSGLRFKADHEFEIDDSVSVVVDLSANKRPGGKLYTLPCQVVRVVEEDTRNELQYGCVFTGDQNEYSDALCSFLFKKQREFLNSRKK